MRRFMLTTVMLAMSGFAGCGGGVETTEPARLTPEKEQEILNQVEGNAAQEEGKS